MRNIVSERIVANEVHGISVYLPHAMAKAVGGATVNGASPLTQAVYAAVGKGIPDRLMLRANKALAQDAQRAIVAGWRSRLPLKSWGYRAGSDPNHDRLSGKLGDALASDAMTKGTSPRGISFLNVGVLNSEARHWYRVNYGAQGPVVGAVRRAKSYPVMVEGHTIQILRDEHQPAPMSFLPRRFVFEGATYFAPRRGPADVRGGGHRPALFTELGFREVAQNADRVYRATFRTFVNEQEVKRLNGKPYKVITTSKGVR